MRVGIVHGDATALAGWSFAHDALDDPARAAVARRRAPRGARRRVRLDPHLPRRAARLSSCARGRLTVINNGAAGMPNFSGTALRPGLAHRHHALAASRRSTASCATACTSTRSRSPTTSDAFLDRFLARWPAGLGGACVVFPADRRRGRTTRSRRRGRARRDASPRLTVWPVAEAARCASRSACEALHHHAGARRRRRHRRRRSMRSPTCARSASRSSWSTAAAATPPSSARACAPTASSRRRAGARSQMNAGAAKAARRRAAVPARRHAAAGRRRPRRAQRPRAVRPRLGPLRRQDRRPQPAAARSSAGS